MHLTGFSLACILHIVSVALFDFESERAIRYFGGTTSGSSTPIGECFGD